MFIIIIKAQKSLKIGNKFIFPLDKITDRDPVKSYIVLANIKRQALESPWRNIISKAPFIPASVPKNRPEIKNLIWATEE